MRRFDVVKVLAGGALALGAARARAKPTASEKAMAIQLFDQAQQLMAAGHYAAACPKYRESQRFDPQLGTLLHLAECYQKTGKTASAWARFMDAIEIADKRGDPRAKPARKHAAALRAKLSMLTIKVTSPVPAGIQVRLDGQVIERATWGLRQPVDPGSHKIEASAPERHSWDRTVDVGANAARVTVTVPELPASSAKKAAATPVSTTASKAPAPAASKAPAPAASKAPAPAASKAPASAASKAPASAASKAPASAASKAPPSAPSKAAPVAPSPSPVPPPDIPPDETETNRGGTQRTIGVVVTVLGAAGLAAGGVLGLTAKSKFNDAYSHCNGNRCDNTGLALRQDAVSRGNLATIVVGIGGGVLAAGAVIWLTAPHGTTQVGLGPGTVSLKGRF